MSREREREKRKVRFSFDSELGFWWGLEERRGLILEGLVQGSGSVLF